MGDDVPQEPREQRDDPEYVRALLEDLKCDNMQMLSLIETSVNADPETEAAQAVAFHKQIERLMAETDTRMNLFQECIVPWGERRKVFPADLVRDIDTFLRLLQKGLEGIQAQVDFRVKDLEHRRDEIRKRIDEAKRTKEGMGGYRQKGEGGRMFDKKA